MGYFPFFVDISGKSCVIAGGGRVALRKAEKLLPFGADITVIAPDICPEIEAMDVRKLRREFRDSDLIDAFMAIAASGDRELNSRIYRLCTERRIPVNTVDDIENCGFIFPALVHKGDITVGISTGGTSPVFARFLRESCEELLDGHLIDIAELLAKYRPQIKQRFGTERQRKGAMETVLRLCLNSSSLPDDEEIERLLEGIG